MYCSRRRIRQRNLCVSFCFTTVPGALAGIEPARSCDHRVDVLQQSVGMLFQMTDEVVEPETYGALPLSYGAAYFKSRRWDSNPQPPGYEPCTPIRQSVMFWWRRGCWSEAFSYGNRTRQPLRGRQTHWTEPMYSEPAVAVFETPNEVVAEMSALIGRVSFRQWAHARPSPGDAVAFTFPGSLQVRYLRVVIVTM